MKKKYISIFILSFLFPSFTLLLISTSQSSSFIFAQSPHFTSTSSSSFTATDSQKSSSPQPTTETPIAATPELEVIHQKICSSNYTVKQEEKNKSDDITNSKQDALVNRKTAPKRLAKDGIFAVLKHLGQNTSQHAQVRSNASSTASNKTDISLSATDEHSPVTNVTQQTKVSTSEMSASCLKQPQHPSTIDADHENKCSLPSLSPVCSGTREGSMKECKSSLDVVSGRRLEEHSLPNRFGKREQPQSWMEKSVEQSLEDGAYDRNKCLLNMSCGPVKGFDIFHPEADDFMFPRYSHDLEEAQEPEMDKLDEEPRESVISYSKQAKISTSEVPVCCSKQPQHLSDEDADHENRCSSPSLIPACGTGEGLLKESKSLLDVDNTHMLEECSLPKSFGKVEQPQSRRKKSTKQRQKDGGSNRNNFSNTMSRDPVKGFDIFHHEADNFIPRYYHYLDEAEEPDVDKLSEEPRKRIVRPGMILLKSYISDSEQVYIARKCRELGIGPGGFYQPSFKYGAKLRLHMMCLGLDWDPQTKKYQKRRRIDKSRPPDFPLEFHSLVDRAMLDSFALIRRDLKVFNAEDILPRIIPDICIVNFYSETGRLGLHQDRDESKESLARGLPVISFSVGDSAEFLYGDDRDINKAEKLLLESGDVLIFGGQSRHVFHGVDSIIPGSAPRFLWEETRLLPGRLNLTFRQY